MSEVDGRSLERAGRDAHASADYATATTSYEAAFAAYRTEGDLGAAARAARTVAWFRGWVFGDWAVHRGWIARARRLLEHADDAHGRGWVVLDDALGGNDLEVQRAQYLEAIGIARRMGDLDLECDATASLGMMLVFSGQTEQGLTHLDEALAAICGGDVSELPVVEGCLCGLVTACERVRDVARAEQWLRAAREVMQRKNLLAVAGHCRAHYAGLLIAAGRWADADDELISALDLLPHGIAAHASARCRLADLRVRQGQFEAAEQLLVGLDHHPDAVVPLAAVFLATSRHDLAAELLDRAQDSNVHDDHGIVPLLALSVEVHVASGDWERARNSRDRLVAFANAQPTTYGAAMAAVACARLCSALGDADASIHWHRAVTGFASAHLPAETAVARVGLARAIARDRRAAAIAELEAAHATFEDLGARRDADRAAALLRQLGGRHTTGPKRLAQLTRREDEVLELIALGLSNAQIGERLFISAKTAEHHVGRILAKHGLRSRAEAAARLNRAGQAGGAGSMLK